MQDNPAREENHRQTLAGALCVPHDAVSAVAVWPGCGYCGLAALSHPNLVVIFDTGVENGVSFAVMELLEGETLARGSRAGR